MVAWVDHAPPIWEGNAIQVKQITCKWIYVTTGPDDWYYKDMSRGSGMKNINCLWLTIPLFKQQIPSKRKQNNHTNTQQNPPSKSSQKPAWECFASDRKWRRMEVPEKRPCCAPHKVRGGFPSPRSTSSQSSHPCRPRKRSAIRGWVGPADDHCIWEHRECHGSDASTEMTEVGIWKAVLGNALPCHGQIDMQGVRVIISFSLIMCLFSKNKLNILSASRHWFSLVSLCIKLCTCKTLCLIISSKESINPLT